MSTRTDLTLVMRESDLQKWRDGMVAKHKLDSDEDLGMNEGWPEQFGYRNLAKWDVAEPFSMEGLTVLMVEETNDLTADFYQIEGVPFYGYHGSTSDYSAGLIGGDGQLGAKHTLDANAFVRRVPLARSRTFLEVTVAEIMVGLPLGTTYDRTATSVGKAAARDATIYTRIIQILHPDFPYREQPPF